MRRYEAFRREVEAEPSAALPEAFRAQLSRLPRHIATKDIYIVEEDR